MNDKDYMFKIGQAVTVRSDLGYAKRYYMRSGPLANDENYNISLSMRCRAGSIVHISDCTLGKYEIREDGGNCWWTDEMFEEAFKNRIFHGLI